MGVRPGSRVLVSAYTFIATAAAVVSLGSVPEPFDITDSLGIDLADLTTRLRSEVAAVIVVHVNGHMADLHQVRRLVTERGIPLIEDACRGFGASCAGRLAGSVGDIGVFSFQQSKQISAGEGGMIVSSDPVLLARCARQVDLGAVRDEFGRPSWDEPEAIFGENHRMTELQAAILSRQLDRLDAILAQQRIGRSYLRSLLKDRGIKVLSSEDPDGDSGSHLLIPTDSAELAQEVIQRAARARTLVRLIWDRAYYEHAVFQRAFLTPQQLGARPARCAESLAPRLLSVPVPASLGRQEIAQIAEVLANAVRDSNAQGLIGA